MEQKSSILKQTDSKTLTFDDNAIKKKLDFYKKKIDGDDYAFDDNVFDLYFIGRKLMLEENEKYKKAGFLIVNTITRSAMNNK